MSGVFTEPEFHKLVDLKLDLPLVWCKLVWLVGP